MPDEIRLKRLKYRSGHRGCKETDIVLSRFASSSLSGMGPEMLALYERFLDENDVDIWNWLIGAYAPADPDFQPLIDEIREFSLAEAP